MKKKVYFWVAATNPFNSILLQIKLTVKIIREKLDVDCVILTPNTEDVINELKKISNSGDIIFWHYGGYDKYLKYINKKNIYLVYHNITPAYFFIFHEPKVFIGSIIGHLQLKFLKKNINCITMSEYNKSQLAKMGFNKIIISPNIITKEETSQIKKTEYPSILFVGRISPNKNILQLIEQVEKLALYINQTIEFTIIGDGKNNCRYKKKFEEKLKNNYKNLIIKWIKNVSYQDLVKYYSTNWLYVSMSLHEGFGVPVLESIAYGTPALYLECGGQETVLQNLGKVSIAEAKHFYIIMKELLENNEKLIMLFKEQYQVVENFISPKIEERIFEIYKKILN